MSNEVVGDCFKPYKDFSTMQTCFILLMFSNIEGIIILISSSKKAFFTSNWLSDYLRTHKWENYSNIVHLATRVKVSWKSIAYVWVKSFATSLALYRSMLLSNLCFSLKTYLLLAIFFSLEISESFQVPFLNLGFLYLEYY